MSALLCRHHTTQTGRITQPDLFDR